MTHTHTEVAKAYDTLKEVHARSVYDVKSAAGEAALADLLDDVCVELGLRSRGPPYTFDSGVLYLRARLLC